MNKSRSGTREKYIPRFNVRLPKLELMEFSAAEEVLGEGTMSDAVKTFIKARIEQAKEHDPQKFYEIMQRQASGEKKPRRLITPEDLPEGYKEDAPIPLEPYKKKPA